jgi:hypothetical protein
MTLRGPFVSVYSLLGFAYSCGQCRTEYQLSISKILSPLCLLEITLSQCKTSTLFILLIILAEEIVCCEHAHKSDSKASHWSGLLPRVSYFFTSVEEIVDIL